MHKLSICLIAVLVCACLVGCGAEAKKARRLARAERSFEAGEYDKAKIDYMAVLRADPQNAVAIQHIGLIWCEQGSVLPALPFLVKARELKPNDLVSRKKLANAFLAVGESIQANKEAVAILRQAPSDGETLLVLVETVRSPDQLAEVEQELAAFPEKNSAEFHVAAAGLALRKNDQKAAESELRQALATDPKLPTGHTAAAYLATLRKDNTKAGDEFKAAAEFSPIRSNARIQYAQFLLSSGSLDQAKTVLTDVTAKAPDYLPAWRLLSQIAFSQKDYKDALALLENVYSRDRQDIEGHILEANISLAQGQPKKAVENLSKLDSVYKGKVLPIKLNLARAAMADNDHARAETALDEAIAANPNFAEAITAKAELKIRTGHPDEAANAMTELLKARPDLPQARLLLAGAYQLLGKFDLAADALREQIHSWPADARAHVLLSLILREQKNMTEARAELTKAVELMPSEMAIFAQMVDLDLAENDYAAALQRVQARLEKEPASAALRFLEAKIYSAQKNYPAAEAAAQKAIESDPNLLDAYSILVSTYLATNRVPEAIKQAEAVVERQPTNSQAFMTLALLRERMKDFAGAAEAYEKLVDRADSFVPALNNLAYLYTEHLNKPDRAVELARKARSIRPEDGSVADTLGWALFKQQNYAQALPLLQEAVEKLGNAPDPQFHLGMARYMMGQPDAAKSAFEQALKAPVDFAGKEEAQRRLALIVSGASEEAIAPAELEKQVQEHPADVVAWLRLAEAREAANDLPKAAEAYEKARQLNPNLLKANLKLAQLNADILQNKEKALELAKKARDLAPNDASVAATLGKIALQAGNFQWAYSLLQDAARGKGEDPVVLHDLAWAAYDLGKVTQARDTMQKVKTTAAADSPEHNDAELFLAFTLIEKEPRQVSALAPRIEPTLQANAEYLPALVARAAAQAAVGDSASAIAGYEEILRRYPEFAPAQRDLAALYADKPETLAKAGDLATRAREALRDDPRLTRTLAEIKFGKKDYRYAVQLYQESDRKQPLDAGGLYQLGIALLETGKSADGLTYLHRAITRGLDGPLAAEAQRRIAAAEGKGKP